MQYDLGVVSAPHLLKHFAEWHITEYEAPCLPRAVFLYVDTIECPRMVAAVVHHLLVGLEPLQCVAVVHHVDGSALERHLYIVAVVVRTYVEACAVCHHPQSAVKADVEGMLAVGTDAEECLTLKVDRAFAAVEGLRIGKAAIRIEPHFRAVGQHHACRSACGGCHFHHCCG